VSGLVRQASGANQKLQLPVNLVGEFCFRRGITIKGRYIVKSVDEEQSEVRTYCFDMLGQIAALLESRGGEPELADILRALARSQQAYETLRSGAYDDQRCMAPEPASFA